MSEWGLYVIWLGDVFDQKNNMEKMKKKDKFSGIIG